MSANIICQRCQAVNKFTVWKSGPHLKATCSQCKEYIKFLPSDFMLFQTVDSSFIESIGYNYFNRLQVIFKNGNKYAYLDFYPSNYKEMMKAESIGKYYQTQIKGKFLTESGRILTEQHMADKIIKMSIDVTKLNQSWFIKGEKGIYANITLLYNEAQDQYGNNGMIVHDVPKAIYEADKTAKGPILGNCKEFSKAGAAAPAAAATATAAPANWLSGGAAAPTAAAAAAAAPSAAYLAASAAATAPEDLPF